MPGCVLRYCKNNSKNVSKCKGTSFHRFPRPTHANREKWIKFVQINRSEETWMPSDFACICSLHFREQDKYTTNKGRLFLKKSAVPCNDPNSKDDPGTAGPGTADHGTADLKSEPVSDSDSIDSPIKINILRQKLRKSTAVRKKLTDKIKKVQRQNRNLKKKCEFLTNVVMTLKKKFFHVSLAESDLMAKAEVD